MSSRPTDTTPECVPECVPSVSQEGSRDTGERVCPPSPLPTGGTHSTSPSRVCPATVSPDPHDDTPTYGLCTACGSVEVALTNPTATRDLSAIGEHYAYPTGYGCEVCS